MRLLLSKAFFISFLLLLKRGRIKKSYNKKEIFSVFFHRPDIIQFERWIQWCIKNNFEFLTLSDLEDLLLKRAPYKKRYIWLSFDDGWRNNYTEVLPILRKYNIPTTIFIATDFISKGISWLEIARLNHKITLPVEELKAIPEIHRIQLFEDLKTHSQYKEMKREFMTWDELKEISEDPLITIGNHTHNHVICTNCTLKQLKEEVSHSHELLQKNCSSYTSAFAYPNGNYNEKTQNFLKPEFKYIVVVDNKNVTLNTNIKKISRICLGDKLSMEENILNMFGYRKKIVSALKSITR